MNPLNLTMVFLMGLTGSLHCAGMCGPIMWILPFQSFRGYKKVLAVGLYHLGRVSVYATLAILLHSFRGMFDPKWQQYVSIILGGTLLGFGILSFAPSQFFKLKLPWTEYVKNLLSNFMLKPSFDTIALSGVMNGLLPCGLVYMALSASLASDTNIHAMEMMYAFGIGTLPMLLSITLLKARLTFLRTSSIKKVVPVIVLFFGCLFVLRGLNLGIPYLSPKVAVVQHEIINSCCTQPK